MANLSNSIKYDDSKHLLEFNENSKLIWFHDISAVILNSWEIKLNFVHYKEEEEWMKEYVNKILWNGEFNRLINLDTPDRNKFAELILKGEDPAQLYKKD